MICVSGGRFHTSGYKRDICSLPHSGFFAARHGFSRFLRYAPCRVFRLMLFRQEPRAKRTLVMQSLPQMFSVGRVSAVPGRDVLRLPPSTPINSYTAHSGCFRTQFFFVDIIVNSSEGEI